MLSSVLTWMRIPKPVWLRRPYRRGIKAGRSTPVPVEKQVAILYAVVNGILTQVEVEDIQSYEEGLYTFLDSDAAGVSAMEGIRSTGKLEGETEEKLKTALKDYTDRFLKAR